MYHHQHVQQQRSRTLGGYQCTLSLMAWSILHKLRTNRLRLLTDRGHHVNRWASVAVLPLFTARATTAAEVDTDNESAGPMADRPRKRLKLISH